MLRALKLSRRLAVLIAIFSLGFVIYGIWSFKTLNELKVIGKMIDLDAPGNAGNEVTEFSGVPA